MTLSLNSALDIDALAKEFGEKKRIQIPNIFPAPQAQDLYEDLAGKTPWGLFYRKSGVGERLHADDLKKLSQNDLREIYQHIFFSARTSYQFMYYFNGLGENISPAGQLVVDFVNYINTRPVLDFITQITGISGLIRADGQATRYIGNCFLHPHTDQQESTGRRVAYVLNMTKNWRPDWGGYLQFFDGAMNVEEGFMPTFNTLNLFAVPRGHSVSLVSPFCGGERLSITGWFRDKEAS